MDPEPSLSQRGILRTVAVLSAVFAVLYLPWLALEPPIFGLESTRILVAREMARSGDWIVPTQNGLTYLAKPPLGYWLTVIGSAPFGGVSVASARLVSALCMLALALAVALLGQRHLGERVGRLAGLCVLGTALCVQKGLRAELEASFALFTSLAILGLYCATWTDRYPWRWSIAAGLALGAAILIKGPLAMLAFLLALGGLVTGTRTRSRTALGRGMVALLVGALAGGAWLVALSLNGADTSDFNRLVDEAFKRVHDAGASNREPWWFYGPSLVMSFLPATLLLPALIARRAPARPDDERERSLFGLLVGWSVITMLVMSLSAGKEARYLMPLVPGWSLLASWAWFRADAAPWLELWRRGVTHLGVALSWLLPAAFVIVGWKLWPAATTGTSIAVGLSIVALVLLRLGRRPAGTTMPRAVMLWSALLVDLLAVRVFWAAGPIAQKHVDYPIEQMGTEIAAQLAPGEPLVQLGEYSSYVQLQVDHPFRLAPTLGDVSRALVMKPHTRFVLARSRYLAPGSEPGWIEVGSWPFGSENYRLLRVPLAPRSTEPGESLDLQSPQAK